MATVNDLLLAAQAETDRKFLSGNPAAFTESEGFIWVKEAYDQISSALRIPRTYAPAHLVDRTYEYALPNDIHGGFSGLIAVTINDKPLIRKTANELRERYGDTWLEPEGVDPYTYYCEWRDSSKVYFVSIPDKSITNGIEYVYVKSVTKPTATSDAVPFEFNQFVGIIPQYIAGKMMSKDKQGRGATKIAEFLGLLKKQMFRNNRVGRTTGGEAYTQDLKDYRYNFRRGRGGKR